MFSRVAKFTADADHVVRRYDQIEKLPAIIRKKLDALKTGEQIEELFAAAKRSPRSANTTRRR